MAAGIMSSAQASTTGIQVPTLFQRSLDFWSLGLGGNHIAMFLQVRRHRRKGKRPQLRRPGRRPRVGVCSTGDVGESFSNGKARSLPTKAARRAVSGKGRSSTKIFANHERAANPACLADLCANPIRHLGRAHLLPRPWVTWTVAASIRIENGLRKRRWPITSGQCSDILCGFGFLLQASLLLGSTVICTTKAHLASIWRPGPHEPGLTTLLLLLRLLLKRA